MRLPIIAAAALLSGGQHAVPMPDRHPVRPPQHIYIPEDYDVTFDARPGDFITVIMYPDGDPVARCFELRGEPIYNPYTDIYTCDGVEF